MQHTLKQARWAAFVPALMSSVLLFMDQNITVRLVNSPAHKLKKGYGLHLVRTDAGTTQRLPGFHDGRAVCTCSRRRGIDLMPLHTFMQTTGHAGDFPADLCQLALRAPLASGRHRTQVGFCFLPLLISPHIHIHIKRIDRRKHMAFVCGVWWVQWR